MFLSYEYLVFSIMVSGVLVPNLLLSLRKNHHEDMKCLNSIVLVPHSYCPISNFNE